MRHNLYNLQFKANERAENGVCWPIRGQFEWHKSVLVLSADNFKHISVIIPLPNLRVSFLKM